MSTSVTLRALTPDQCPVARAFMSTSLGYGRPLTSVMASPHHANLRRFDVFDPSIPMAVIESDHEMHADDVERQACVAHRITTLIGPDLPLLDRPLAHRIIEAIGWDHANGVTHTAGPDERGRYEYRDATAAETRQYLMGWLHGALGRHLFWCYE